MKRRLIKLTLLLVTGLAMVTVSSCNDDETTCVSQQLADFNLILQDIDEVALLDEEDFDVDALKVVYFEEENEVEVEFELKEASNESLFISSTEINQLGLTAPREFSLMLGEDLLGKFEVSVTESSASACRVYTYSAVDEAGENLETTTIGTTQAYILVVSLPETE